MILRKASQSAKYLTAAMAIESKQLKCADLDIKISKPKKKVHQKRKRYLQGDRLRCRYYLFANFTIKNRHFEFAKSAKIKSKSGSC